MSELTLRIPVSKSLKKSAEAVAGSYGFSLSEAIKVLIQKLAKREVALPQTHEEVVHLSKRAEKRYAKIIADIEAGRNVYKAESTEEFIRQLKSG